MKNKMWMLRGWIESALDFLEVFAPVMVVVLIVIVIGIGIMSAAVSLDLRFVNNLPVTVFVDKKQVYQGINGCVEITSSGATTVVKINGGFLCAFPVASFVSNDVKV